jgi:hypothetical protein
MKAELTQEVVKHAAAAGSVAGAILTWWPLVFAIPGCLYYVVLLVEKFSGTQAKDWLRKNETS